MSELNASAAWDIGYGMAVKGFSRIVPGGTWIVRFSKDFLEGWDAAVTAGVWGTY